MAIKLSDAYEILSSHGVRSPSEQMFLFHLINMGAMNKPHKSSAATIGRAIHSSPRTVQRIVRALEIKGSIEIKRNPALKNGKFSLIEANEYKVLDKRIVKK